MIWQVWLALFLSGHAWAYLAFVKKTSPVFSSLLVIGHFGVLAFGSLGVETQFTTSVETPVAVLSVFMAVVGTLVFVVALTGTYADDEQDDLDSPAPSLLDRIADLTT